MAHLVPTLGLSFLIGSFSFFAGNEDDPKVSDEFEIQPDSIMDCGVSCLERLEKCPKTYSGRNVVATLVCLL